MVGEIVVDSDPPDHAEGFHPALGVSEFTQRSRTGFGCNTDMLGRGDGCQCVELVVHAAQLPSHLAGRPAALQHLECVSLALRAEIAHGRSEAAHLAPAALVQYPGQAFFQPVHHHPPGSRHGAHQVVELALDRRQVVEDVGVVVLEVVQHRSARPVVDELAALVEEGGVVLVGFDHKGGSGAGSGRDAEIQRNAADQKAGIAARMLQDPGQHRSRGGLAVGAGNRHHMAPVQQVRGQPLGPAGVGSTGVQDGFHQRIPRLAVGTAGP